MIYSRWRPAGGYDYFATNVGLAIGDDPEPMSMPADVGGIGVPAQECGYFLPPGARHVGSGDLPVGLVATSQVAALSGTDGGTGIPCDVAEGNLKATQSAYDAVVAACSRGSTQDCVGIPGARALLEAAKLSVSGCAKPATPDDSQVKAWWPWLAGGVAVGFVGCWILRRR